MIIIMKRYLFLKPILPALILMLSMLIPASGAYTVKDSVSIDWQKGEIRATAFYSGQFDESGAAIDFSSGDTTPTAAKMDAYRKARENAVLMIADYLKNIRLDGKQTIFSLISSDDETARKIGEVIPARISSRETPDGFFSARSDARLKLSYILAAVSYEYPQAPFPEMKENPLATEYSSLIIDARGEMKDPVLLPSIVDQDGLEIYGKRYINPAYMLKKGMAVYCLSESEAKHHAYAGDRPYFARAVGTVPGGCIISNRDKRRILGHKKTVEKLKQCRVIIIIDPEKKESGIKKQ
jgi:hypothetical protein